MLKRTYVLSATTETGDEIFYTANPVYRFSNSIANAKQFPTKKSALDTAAERPGINYHLYQLDHSDDIAYEYH